MNCLPKKNLFIILLATIIMLPLFVFASDNILIKSAVIFNTSCAKCHEGGCSGRMSFQLPKDAANQHILRHGGNLPQVTVKQLFVLLRYMKEKCSFYPFDLALVKDRIWSSDTLAKLQSPSNQNYFMHLGFLESGSYQLLFEEVNNNFKFCVEIISEEFDFIDCDNLAVQHNQKSISFQVDEHLEYFLRIKAQKPIHLKRIELVGP